MLLIALLHVLAYWGLSSTIKFPIAHNATALEWVMISSPRTVVPIRSAMGDAGVRSTISAPTPRPHAPALSSPDDSPHDQSTGQPATDWNAELELVAKGIAGGDESRRQRDFGFPQHVPPTKTPSFDWDRAHTHRIEIAPEGGMIIHISDKCVMVFMPLPFAFCGVGKKEANGHLLDHMNDGPIAEAPAP